MVTPKTNLRRTIYSRREVGSFPRPFVYKCLQDEFSGWTVSYRSHGGFVDEYYYSTWAAAIAKARRLVDETRPQADKCQWFDTITDGNPDYCGVEIPPGDELCVPHFILEARRQSQRVISIPSTFHHYRPDDTADENDRVIELATATVDAADTITADNIKDLRDFMYGRAHGIRYGQPWQTLAKKGSI